MRSSAICVRKQPICLHCFQLIAGPNSDDADQRSGKRILICNLCVKPHMVPFRILCRLLCVGLFQKKFVLSKCQSGKYAGNMPAT